jgi:hypothetical protein
MKFNNKYVLNLRVGEIAEVRSRAEILATLDSTGRLDGLPFMPEMLRYCGKRLRVYKRADKACDTIGKTGTRRMENAVHLESVRCDGVAHGGCQAGCLIFWKEAWLKPVITPTDKTLIVEHKKSFAERSPTLSQKQSIACTEDAIFKATRKKNDATTGNEEIFSCQATELTRATSYLAWWDIRQYVRDVRSGNISLSQFLYGVTMAAYNMIVRNVRRCALGLRALITFLCGINSESPEISSSAFIPALRHASDRIGIKQKTKAVLNDLLVEHPCVRGHLKKTPHLLLNLQSGELVQVKSKREIFETLDTNNKNRGLSFDVEMLPYCGKTFRVHRRVEQIINERTGKMMHMPNDCIILEDVTCGGCLSTNRLFCPRSIYPYWREIWLKRVNRP